MNKYGLGGSKSFSYVRPYIDCKTTEPCYTTLLIFKAHIMYIMPAINVHIRVCCNSYSSDGIHI